MTNNDGITKDILRNTNFDLLTNRIFSALPLKSVSNLCGLLSLDRLISRFIQSTVILALKFPLAKKACVFFVTCAGNDGHTGFVTPWSRDDASEELKVVIVDDLKDIEQRLPARLGG